jgi:hypothetical protein
MVFFFTMKTFSRLKLAAAVGGAFFAASAIMPNAASAQSACVNGSAPAYWTSLGSTGCTRGDKLYSDFGFTGVSGTFDLLHDTDTDRYTFQGSGLMISHPGATYTYKVTVVGTDHTLDRFRGSMSSSDDPIPVATKTLTATGGLISTSSLNPGTGTGNVVNFLPGTTSTVFTANFLVGDGPSQVDVITDSLWQVPGPLPILGAGAAFGMSRKLRGRIKASA